MLKFVLLGVGYVAPRHMQAIKDIGGELVAIMDPNDSVGLIDSYYPGASYFREFENLDRYCSKRNDIDYCVICTPNFLHDPGCRWAMRSGMNVICEKPLVLREKNLDGLLEIESQTGKKVWNILQLRLSDVYQDILRYLEEIDDGHLIDVALNYFAPRGRWYDYSWKMDNSKSGGLECNIGIHLLDLLCQFFGSCGITHYNKYNSGREVHFTLDFNNANVRVKLSLDRPEKREIIIDGKSFDLSKNMKNLHTVSYLEILNGNGFGIEDARPAIKLCDELRRIYEK